MNIKSKVLREWLAGLIGVVGIVCLIHVSTSFVGDNFTLIAICIFLALAVTGMVLFFFRFLFSFGVVLAISRLSIEQKNKLRVLDDELVIKLQSLNQYDLKSDRNSCLILERLAIQTKVSLTTYAKNDSHLPSRYENFNSYLSHTFYSSGNI